MSKHLHVESHRQIWASWRNACAGMDFLRKLCVSLLLLECVVPVVALSFNLGDVQLSSYDYGQFDARSGIYFRPLGDFQYSGIIRDFNVSFTFQNVGHGCFCGCTRECAVEESLCVARLEPACYSSCNSEHTSLIGTFCDEFEAQETGSSPFELELRLISPTGAQADLTGIFDLSFDDITGKGLGKLSVWGGSLRGTGRWIITGRMRQDFRDYAISKWSDLVLSVNGEIATTTPNPTATRRPTRRPTRTAAFTATPQNVNLGDVQLISYDYGQSDIRSGIYFQPLGDFQYSGIIHDFDVSFTFQNVGHGCFCGCTRECAVEESLCVARLEPACYSSCNSEHTSLIGTFCDEFEAQETGSSPFELELRLISPTGAQADLTGIFDLSFDDITGKGLGKLSVSGGSLRGTGRWIIMGRMRQDFRDYAISKWIDLLLSVNGEQATTTPTPTAKRTATKVATRMATPPQLGQQHAQQLGQQHAPQLGPQHARQQGPQHARQLGPQHARQLGPQHAPQLGPQHAPQLG
eukprot:CAMPEP_0184673186 /NCGR_PEP_ID=MMETSP0308-20130426/86541_1 /TAXON_ID=38269 /ORGANISM="Gloeochaete witrockiana, Strain SAG 46.84" /LENGTH=521 /DNA_ID=CAMNT_0027120645 /DNA_START=123 /DNA_END=1689 /DNA_ORIENTATION=+